jgi:hypothetical protein
MNALHAQVAMTSNRNERNHLSLSCEISCTYEVSACARMNDFFHYEERIWKNFENRVDSEYFLYYSFFFAVMTIYNTRHVLHNALKHCFSNCGS